ncbi:MAG: hypothetical protein JO260_01840 [Acidobacteria bacterium]|nr:hypothetical protein [Acidobacteriota bacterium]
MAKGARISEVDSSQSKVERSAGLQASERSFSRLIRRLLFWFATKTKQAVEVLWRELGTDHQRAGFGETVRRNAAFSEYFIHGF